MAGRTPREIEALDAFFSLMTTIRELNRRLTQYNQMMARDRDNGRRPNYTRSRVRSRSPLRNNYRFRCQRVYRYANRNHNNPDSGEVYEEFFTNNGVADGYQEQRNNGRSGSGSGRSPMIREARGRRRSWRNSRPSDDEDEWQDVTDQDE